MSINRVSVVFTEANRDAILSAIKSIREHLPFLIELSPTEKKKMSRMGDRSLPFVEKALEIARQNPGFLPKDFEVEELQKDFDLFQGLFAVLLALRKLVEEAQDTTTAAGSEAYNQSLLVYGYAKANGKATAGLEGAVKELKGRFTRGRRPQKPVDPQQ